MYQVFNMGHRLEIFTDEQTAVSFIGEAAKFNLQAQVVGRVEAAAKKELLLQVKDEIISY
jgi:phosphoribosylformylglycinamidine cyclo-ligase